MLMACRVADGTVAWTEADCDLHERNQRDFATVHQNHDLGKQKLWREHGRVLWCCGKVWVPARAELEFAGRRHSRPAVAGLKRLSLQRGSALLRSLVTNSSNFVPWHCIPDMLGADLPTAHGLQN